MITYVVAPSANPDGILAHTIANRFFETEHFFARYNSTLHSLQDVYDQPVGDVIVADIPLTHESEEYESLFARIAKKHRSFQWFGHDASSLDHAETFSKYCDPLIIQPGHSSAKIMGTHFSVDDSYGTFLMNIAQSYEFEQDNPLTAQGEELDALIKVTPLPDLVDDLTHGKVWKDGKLVEKYAAKVEGVGNRIRTSKEKLGKGYKELSNLHAYNTGQYHDEKANLAEARELMAEMGVTEKKLVSGLADPVLYMKAGPQHLKEVTGADVTITMFKGMKDVVILGNSPDILRYCVDNGGSGSGHNGHFLNDVTVTPDNFKEQVGFYTEYFCESVLADF
tara:strand:+ start:1318 stop:2328 length:1011 start_codon:yes stop_codon:yes gene_type:complete